LDKFYPELEKRQDKGVTPYNLRNCAYHEEFERDKIVYSNMTGSLPFVYDQDRFYTNDKMFIITGRRDELKYLTGYFNSKISTKWIRKNCPKLGNEGIELRKVFFENIPVLVPEKEEQEQIIRLVENIQQEQKRTDNEFNKCRENKIQKMDEQINMVFYLLYELTKEEISFVEQKTN